MALIIAEKMLLMVDFLFPKGMSRRCSFRSTNLTVLLHRCWKWLKMWWAMTQPRIPWTLWEKKWRCRVSIRWSYFSSCSTTELVGAMIIALMVCLHPPPWQVEGLYPTWQSGGVQSHINQAFLPESSSGGPFPFDSGKYLPLQGTIETSLLEKH